MKIVVITGMSGAGKSACLNVFEDMGYYAIDNLPPALLNNFIELSKSSNKKIEKLACVVDIRGGIFFNDLIKAITDLRMVGVDVSIIYLDASEGVLVRRYKEKRRPHPLSIKGSVIEGIEEEREILQDIKSMANEIINTDDLTLGQLKNKINFLFRDGSFTHDFHINVVSFGFKNGILLDADMVFDVRFLPNPFYIDYLKEKNGLNQEVYDFVFRFDETKIFMDKTLDLLEFLIPKYKKEGKTNLVIGMGCTGGKHRSTAIAIELSKRLNERGEESYVSHRDSHLW